MFKPFLMTAVLFTAVPAMAADAPVAPSVHVVTADLDLSTAKGRIALNRRIDTAVNTVCGADTAPRTGILIELDRCHATAGKIARSQRDAILAAIGAKK